jgi:ribose/xylose/arabinose/galactoside ABC-type transport system permease subunit
VTETLVPVASALGFTLGCAAIHLLHRHALRITPILCGLIFFLSAALVVVWIVQGGPAQVDDAVMLDASGMSEAGMPVPAP